MSEDCCDPTRCPVCDVPHEPTEDGLIPLHAAESGLPVCDGTGLEPVRAGGVPA